MRVSQLYQNGPLTGQDVYIVGQGPSMTVFPWRWLQTKTCVLLNDAQKYFTRLGPVAVANNLSFLRPLSPWIKYPVVKGRLLHEVGFFERDDNHVSWDHESLYVYSYRVMETDGRSSDDWAFLWSEYDYLCTAGTVVNSAIQIAAFSGARSITLVGCDCTAICGMDYHINETSLRKQRREKNPKAWSKGQRPQGNAWKIPRASADARTYGLYRESLVRMKKECWDRFKIPVMSLNPFIGSSKYEQQLPRILSWGRDS